jgi:hypothetical protein
MPTFTGARADAVAAHLRTAHTHLTRPARWHRTQHRWATASPPLATLNPVDFHDRFTDPRHPQHTATCVALLRLHQAGDTDATTLLLTAVAPIVGSVARHHDRANRFDHLWAATARLLATGDPNSYLAVGRPFLVTFMGRLRRDAQRSRFAEDHSIIATTLNATGVEQPHGTPAFGPRVPSTVEDAVIARGDLGTIADYLHTTTSGARRNELINHTIHAQPITPAGRVRVHRLRHQLRGLLDAA